MAKSILEQAREAAGRFLNKASAARERRTRTFSNIPAVKRATGGIVRATRPKVKLPPSRREVAVRKRITAGAQSVGGGIQTAGSFLRTAGRDESSAFARAGTSVVGGLLGGTIESIGKTVSDVGTRGRKAFDFGEIGRVKKESGTLAALSSPEFENVANLADALPLGFALGAAVDVGIKGAKGLSKGAKLLGQSDALGDLSKVLKNTPFGKLDKLTFKKISGLSKASKKVPVKKGTKRLYQAIVPGGKTDFFFDSLENLGAYKRLGTSGNEMFQFVDVKKADLLADPIRPGVFRAKVADEAFVGEDIIKATDPVGARKASTKASSTGSIDKITTIADSKSPAEWDISDMRDISNVAKGFKNVYRNIERSFGSQFPKIKKTLLDPFDSAKGSFIKEQSSLLDDLDIKIVKGKGIKQGSEKSTLVQRFGEGDISLEKLQETTDDWKDIVEADTYFRGKYDDLIDRINGVRAKVYPNDPTKIVPRREDYYRHFREMKEGIGGLLNIFDTPANIDPGLAGVSAFTKPRAKFLSLAQKRVGGKTEIDAVGGFLDYIRQASYAIHIDPQISKFRNIRKELVTATGEEALSPAHVGKVNNLIEFLDDFANDLAGKSNPLDRGIQKYIPGGRQGLRAVSWLNNRVKANVIVGNLSSAWAQLYNTPQAIADMGGTQYLKGVGRALSGISGADNAASKSVFLTERYFNDYAKFDTGMLKNVKKAAVWVIQVGDELATKAMWNGYYDRAIKQGVENASKVADDLTRSMVAGRGVGEVPLIQKSKVFQVMAPFQLEVANLWHVMGDWVSKKEFSKLAKFSVAAFLSNRIAEQVRGSDVTFDPINASIEATQAFKEEDDKRVGALRAGGRLAGEVLSNLPLGQSVAGVVPEFGFKVGKETVTREELFGAGDPTRFGSGLFATKGIQDFPFKVAPSFGGGQVKKTLQGAKALKEGFSESPSGRVRFPVAKTPANVAKNLAFGQFSTKDARAYFEAGGIPLGEKQSRVLKKLEPSDRADFFKQIQKAKEINRKSAKGKKVTKQTAKMIVEQIKGMEAGDREELLQRYKETRLLTDDVAAEVKRMNKVTTEVEKGAVFSVIRGISSNAGRATYIIERAGELEPSKREAFLQELARTGALTKALKKEISKQNTSRAAATASRR